MGPAGVGRANRQDQREDEEDSVRHPGADFIAASPPRRNPVVVLRL